MKDAETARSEQNMIKLQSGQLAHKLFVCLLCVCPIVILYHVDHLLIVTLPHHLRKIQFHVLFSPGGLTLLCCKQIHPLQEYVIILTIYVACIYLMISYNGSTSSLC